jgi:hypothetical protein
MGNFERLPSAKERKNEMDSDVKPAVQKEEEEKEEGKKRKKDRGLVETPAGPRIEYSRGDRFVAALLSGYLILAFIGVLWFILDVWMGQFTLFQCIGYAVPTTEAPRRLFQLVLYGMAGGWLGGTISAAHSLQSHYTAPVENVGDLAKQEKTRFHAAWWSRWFWGPWKGMGLALIVSALVRSGVMVFAASPAETATATESFATFGLGALVGLGAKDVIEKLIQTVRTWLKVEEPEAPKLAIEPSKPDAAVYGGGAIKFTVEPAIPVTWAIDPAGDEVGTIVNGIFRPAEAAPSNGPEERTVIVTATSKADSDRSASTSFVLKKTKGT